MADQNFEVLMPLFTLRNALIFSVLLHLLVTGMIALVDLWKRRPPPVASVEIELLAPSPVPAPQDSAQRRPRPQESQQQQIVEQDEKSANDERPDNTRFLSVKDQTVRKETVARERGEFRNLEKPKSATSKKEIGPDSPEKNKVAGKPRPSLKDLTLGSDPLGAFERKKAEQAAAGSGDDVAQDGDQASRSQDYLRNVETGVETMLNTREFKYYTYYSRIRRQLSQHWEPKVKERLNRLFKQGRSIASSQDHITKLLIVLNEQGNLVRVQILSESGVTDLDEAAMDAFRAAAPFPNPPKGIVEQDGTVKIRWDFVLES